MLLFMAVIGSQNQQERRGDYVEFYEIRFVDFRSVPRTALTTKTLDKDWQYSYVDRSNNGVNGWSRSLLITQIESLGEMPIELNAGQPAVKGAVIFHMSDGKNIEIWYTSGCRVLFNKKYYRWNGKFMDAVFHALTSDLPTCQ
jgi:hypothetical protein